ncbi:MAG TPA: glycosyltransferase family 4 protein [Solirubrobacteraceae bacterium]|jgi:glycosyltransferase involved in cell wall biosynthesis
MKPVLFVTGHAPRDRLGAFARLHEQENVVFALFGGRTKHGVDPPVSPNRGRGAIRNGAHAESHLSASDLPFPHIRVRQQELTQLAASGDYRGVVCSTGGRVALPATWLGARRARVPLLLWTSLWAHPRSPAHVLSYPMLRRLYRSADALVTYGPHVSAYVRAWGARNVHEAPQSVDNDFWSASGCAPPSAPCWPTAARTKFLFAGRPAREKGLGVLLEAWCASGLGGSTAALVLVGAGSCPPWIPAGGAADVLCLDAVTPEELRNMYAAGDVLVLPSIRTRTFLEPWGLVVNEAMNRRLAVVASDAVGAVAGGLVRDGENGLVVPAGDSDALSAAMVRLAADLQLRARLGQCGAEDVRAYSHRAWAEGFSRALSSLDLSLES